jgi:hypothetical protein
MQSVKVTDVVPPDLTGYDLLIANERTAPAGWPPVNALIYADDRDASLVRFADHTAGRLTRYVNIVSPFRVRAKKVPVDHSMQPFMYYAHEEQTEPLATFGQLDGRRKVAIGWDWVAADDLAHEALSIVWVHSLDWLGPNESLPGAVSAGESYPLLAREGAFELVRPDGSRSRVDLIGGCIAPVELLAAGAYGIRGAGGLDLRFAVNPRAADLAADDRPLDVIAGTSRSTAATVLRKSYRDFGWWIGAAVLLVVEIVVFLVVERR